MLCLHWMNGTKKQDRPHELALPRESGKCDALYEVAAARSNPTLAVVHARCPAAREQDLVTARHAASLVVSFRCQMMEAFLVHPLCGGGPLLIDINVR